MKNGIIRLSVRNTAKCFYLSFVRHELTVCAGILIGGKIVLVISIFFN